MERYAKIIDEDTKEVQVGAGCPSEYYVEIGMSKMEVEQAYNGNWYVLGYAPVEPEPTEEEKKENVRNIRNSYLLGTDFTQLDDAPFSEEEKEKYKQYRHYLRDYTDLPNWWEKEPLTFEEWSKEYEVLGNCSVSGG